MSKKFDNIKAFVELININKLNSFSFLDVRKEETKIHNFYKLVIEGKSKEQIEKTLGYKPNSAAFKKLQSRLLEKLQVALYTLDERSTIFTGLGLGFFKLYKALFQHRVLLMLNKKNLSFESIAKDLNKAIELEFPDIILQLARPLRDHYAYIQPNAKKFEYYDSLIDKYTVSYQVELLTSKYYGIISREFIYNKRSSHELVQIIEEYQKKLKSYKNVEKSHRHVFQDFEINSLLYEIKGDITKKINYGLSTLKYFENKPYETYLFRYNISIELIVGYIAKKEYGLALSYVKRIENIFHKGHYNWFRVKDLYYRILIEQKDYQEAYKLVLLCNSHRKIKLYGNLFESWKIKDAYFHFLVQIKKIDQVSDQKSAFRINKFLNEVPVFSKNKRGLNISILIIQMLYYLLRGDSNMYIDRMDSLKQYSYRYLKNDETLRSNCFIKMLLKIPDAHFHPVATRRYTKDLYAKLINSPPTISDYTTNSEIIPYEDLWEMVLDLLEQNRKG